MATYRKRKRSDGTTSIVAIIRRHGHKPISQTFDRKTDAKAWAQKTEDQIKNSQYLDEARKRTLSDLVDRYIQDVLPHKKDGAKTAQLLRWWEKHLGGLKLVQIQPARIIELRDTLSTGVTRLGKQRSPSTVVRYMAALSHCFTTAVKEYQWMQDNPMNRVSKPSEAKGRTRFLSDDELARLTAACQDSGNKYLYPAFLVALSSGARLNEVIGLRWPDVDLVKGSALLHETKNGERRSIAIKGGPLEVLREYAKVRRLDTDLLFPGRTGKPAYIRKPWLRALKEAQIEDFHWHDIRHTTASYLAMNGCSLLEIAEILGHKTLQMVQRYSHLTEKHSHGKIEDMLIGKGLG